MNLENDSSVRFKAQVAYEGSNYHGWALQNDLPTVAGKIEDVLELIFRKRIQIFSAGRTDKGVHAVGQMIHFDIVLKDLDLIKSLDNLLIRINKLLPKDIRLISLNQTNQYFDARFSALSRTYKYEITVDKFGAYPEKYKFSAQWFHNLDLDRLNYSSKSLTGLHDFAAFCRPKENSSTIRTLKEFYWQREKNILTATIKADAFCWNMVRSLVGAVCMVGANKRSFEWCISLLEMKTRSSEYNLAPAKGLTFYDVEYPEESKYKIQNTITKNLRKNCECESKIK